MNTIYDRERTLRGRLNTFIEEQLGLPAKDYYSQLDQKALGELKSVLSDINNIFTLKVCLAFSEWLGQSLNLNTAVREEMRRSILRNPPNANGYDVEISEPIQVIAEIKCNVPINRGTVYGSAQRDGIAKDVNSLVSGKSKSRLKPDACLKFLVLLDTPEIREATKHFVKNMKQHQERMVFVAPDTKPTRKDQVYIVHVSYEA